MAEEDVAAVFGPPWVRESLDLYKAHHRQAEKVVLALRRRLRDFDPTLPSEYDGTAWAKVEADLIEG